ncbi:MAG: D-hexose-6-phosphate mutarotase [Limnobacter sp.]|nr:D-hexose-6-phosphate mutarotase [Limnobacter sp.]
MIWQKLGAQLLSLDSPLFYLSPHRNADTPARGGVPVLFPQFADKGPLQKHGYARNTLWVLDKEEKSEDARSLQVCTELSLDVSKTTWPDWPYAARLQLHIVQRIEHSNQASAQPTQPSQPALPPSTSLEMTLTVTNTGNEAFEFTGGLHPYFAISHPSQFGLIGLADCPIVDKLNPALGFETAQGPSLDGGELERLYLSAPPVRMEGSPLGTVSLSTTGFTNWMVWNPGIELAKTITDLPDDDWARFICVEPVVVDKPVRLQMGESFVGTLSCTWCGQA